MSTATPANQPVSVHILDREYTVGVSADRREGLLSAARLLDGRMRETRGANRMASVDRVAVLVALNLAHELEQVREHADQRDRELGRTLDAMTRKLDALLDA